MLTKKILALLLPIVSLYCGTTATDPLPCSLKAIYPSLPPFWEIKADYLLWQVNMEGLDMAADNVYIDFFPPPIRGRTYGVSFPFKSGFQISLARILPNPEAIKLELIYSWLNPSQKGSISQDPVVHTFPFYSVKPLEKSPNDTIFVIEHSASFESYYNVLDIQFSRQSCLTPFFLISPFLGIRSGWQTQNWNTNEEMFTQNPVISHYLYNYSQTFQGAGVLAGCYFEARFFRNSHYLKNLAIIGKTSSAGILGNIKVDSVLSATSPGSNLTYSNAGKSIFAIVPILDLSIGLRLDSCLSHSKTLVEEFYLEALWNTQSWIGLNKMRLCLQVSPQSANMSVQGLTVGAGMIF
jgi:hypothetical protein